MILLYRVLTLILYPLLLVFIYFRKFLKKEDPLRFKEKYYLLILIQIEKYHQN